MKHCPVCRDRYADETLRFCLEDGTSLVDDDEVKQSSIDTIAFSQPLTADGVLRTDNFNLNPQNAWGKTQDLKTIANSRTTGQTEKRKPNFLPYVLATGLLLLLVSGGIGGWVYFERQNKSPARDSLVSSSSPENAEKTLPANQTVVVEKIALEKPAREQIKSPTQITDAEREQIKKEIAAFVEQWEKLAESRNLPELSGKYAETVDYYDKEGAKLAEVSSEIQKIFTTYEDINITLTNIKVAVNANGNRATAVFDKEWEYENSRDLSDGEAHAELHFQKNGEQWKIVGERFLKIYNMEN